MENLLSKETIICNLEIMKTTIENFNGLDTYAMIEYLAEITSIQATATETQASCKYHLLCAINDELTRQAKLSGNEKIPPSIKKMRADSMCAEWHYLYELATRYSANIVHTIDAVRTKISYLKSELIQR